MYELIFAKRAEKDLLKYNQYPAMQRNLYKLLDIVEKSPLQYPPEYEVLSGEYEGLISRRINRQHRLVYQVYESEKIVKIIQAWTHYE